VLYKKQLRYISVCNGQVNRIVSGAINSEDVIDLSGGNNLTAIPT
jgi:molybdopterin-binding protein